MTEVNFFLIFLCFVSFYHEKELERSGNQPTLNEMVFEAKPQPGERSDYYQMILNVFENCIMD